MHRIPNTRLPLLVAVLAPLLLAAAACGDDDEATRTTDATSTTRASGDGSGDGGADGGGDLVVTLDVHGGFVPVERAVADTADLVLLGDGTLLSPAPTIAIFPGPALTTFQVGHVDPGEVDEVVDAIEALDPAADYARPGDVQVADAPNTTLTLTRPDGTVSITAYALGMADERGPRAELAQVVEQLQALVDHSGEELYEPTALRVHDITDLVGEPPSPTGTSADAEAPPEPTARVLDWPVPHDGRECTVVDDADDVASVLEVLGDATQLDWFDTEAGVRRLVAVPVLPGDDGCPDET